MQQTSFSLAQHVRNPYLGHVAFRPAAAALDGEDALRAVERGAADRVGEGEGRDIGAEEPAVVELVERREVVGCDFFADRSEELLAQHVLDVVHALPQRRRQFCDIADADADVPLGPCDDARGAVGRERCCDGRDLLR